MPMGYEKHGRFIKKRRSRWSIAHLSCRFIGLYEVAYNCWSDGPPAWMEQHRNELMKRLVLHGGEPLNMLK